MAAATALLWVAVCWRIVLTLVRGWKGWRGSITVGMFCLAVMVTGIVWRGPVDSFLGVPNVAGLLARLAIVVGILTGHWTLIPTSRRARIWMGAEAALAIVILSAAWAAAPLHSHEVLDLRPLSTQSLPVAIYTGGVDIHLFVAGTLLTVGLARGCWGSWRSDKAAAVTLGIGALASAVGATAAVLLLLQIGYQVRVGSQPGWLSTSSVNTVVAACGALAAVALLLFPLGEWLQAHSQVRDITPRWEAAIASHPEIQLQQSRWTRMLRPQRVLHRRRIEMEDAATR